MTETTIWEKISQYLDAIKARPVHPEFGCTDWERDECRVLTEILAHKGEGRAAAAARAAARVMYHDNLAHGWGCSRQRDIALAWEYWRGVLAGKVPCPTPDLLRFRAISHPAW